MATFAGDPHATSFPPSSPAPGPMSITQSLPAIAFSQRGFARRRYTGENDARVARDLEVDIPEIVLARPAHANNPRATGDPA